MNAKIAVLALAIAAGACASAPTVPLVPAAPRYPAYPPLEIPAQLQASLAARERLEIGWRRLQSGDLRGANRDFTAILKETPGFYPAEAGLGFALLADRQVKAADTRFAAALTRNDRYLPAWTGLVEAALARDDLAGAVTGLERILVIDPKREGIRSRLELIKFRQVQALIETGRKSRSAGKFEESQAALERALASAPNGGIILRELAITEMARGALPAAETHAGRATQVDPADADAFAVLAGVFEAQERWREASVALAKAAAIDPRPDWREHAEALKDKADMAGLPPEYRSLATAPGVTRALTAAYIGIRLEPLIEKAPRKLAVVATDVRAHWAATWILPLTQAGVMDVLPNHTFQPNTAVRRGDLAQIAAELLPLALGGQSGDLARWRAEKPRFADLAAGNVFYRSAALATAAGAMTVDGDRFQPTRPATGAELIGMVARIDALARR